MGKTQPNSPGPRQTPESTLIHTQGVQVPEAHFLLFWDAKLDFSSQEDSVLFCFDVS